MDKRVTIAVPDQEAGQSQLFIDVDLKEKMAQVALVKLASDISFQKMSLEKSANLLRETTEQVQLLTVQLQRLMSIIYPALSF